MYCVRDTLLFTWEILQLWIIAAALGGFSYIKEVDINIPKKCVEYWIFISTTHTISVIYKLKSLRLSLNLLFGES